MNRCRECGREFVYDRSKGHRKDLCNTCKTNLRNHKKKQKLISLAGGECILCGYKKCGQALAFHHVDPQTKSFEISGGYNRSMESLIEETKKCVLLCMNCHTEFHSRVAQGESICLTSKGS